MTDTFLIVDIEATCWADDDPNPGEMEMISIGIVLVDETGAYIDAFSSHIRPEFSEVSDYCTDLLGLTQEYLETVPTLDHVMGRVVAWLDEHYTKPTAWYSWGAWDNKQIARDCKRKKVSNPLQMEHRDAKKLFQKKHLPGKKRVGFKKAMELIQLEFRGAHHDALSDALNISRMMPWFHVGPDGLNYDGIIGSAWLLSFSDVVSEDLKNVRLLTGWVEVDHKGRFQPGQSFHSSPVEKVEGNTVFTANSVYMCRGQLQEITIPVRAMRFVMNGYSPPTALLMEEGKVEPANDKTIN